MHDHHHKTVALYVSRQVTIKARYYFFPLVSCLCSKPTTTLSDFILDQSICRLTVSSVMGLHEVVLCGVAQVPKAYAHGRPQTVRTTSGFVVI